MKALLLGDISPTPATEELFKKMDLDTLFTDTLELFCGNDINFVNLECAVCECDNPIKKFGPVLKSPLETVDVMKAIGVNYCGLSNNHFFDHGIAGVKESLSALDKAGIGYTGFCENYEDARKNLIIEKDGERVCIIAVCEHEYSYALEDRMGSRPFDEYDTIEDIRKAKAENDRVIVIYHGGKEHCRYPSPRLRKLCHAMARNGADVILGQHSHCISCYEMYENCHILYGQGNFHFVEQMPEHVKKEWSEGLAVKYDTKNHDIEFIPMVVYNENKGIALAKGEAKESIIKDFNERNKTLLNGEWKNRWHKWVEENGEVYLAAIKNALADDATEEQHDRFGHFLDCEAHTDVWRELFPSYNLTNEK